MKVLLFISNSKFSFFTAVKKSGTRYKVISTNRFIYFYSKSKFTTRIFLYLDERKNTDLKKICTHFIERIILPRLYKVSKDVYRYTHLRSLRCRHIIIYTYEYEDPLTILIPAIISITIIISSPR